MVQKGWGKATTLSDHKYLGYKKKLCVISGVEII